jgi:DNA-binding XRE family transcriptional regulator
MTPARIKKIRESLNLTQDELATVLGVTKNTVWRYEDGRGVPGDDVAAKLLNIEASLKDKEERSKLKELRKMTGGVAAIAAVVAMGTALYPGGTTAGAPVAGCAGIATSPAGRSLFNFIGGLFGATLDASKKKEKTSPTAFSLFGMPVVGAAAVGSAAMGAAALLGNDEENTEQPETKEKNTEPTITDGDSYEI